MEDLEKQHEDCSYVQYQPYSNLQYILTFFSPLNILVVYGQTYVVLDIVGGTIFLKILNVEKWGKQPEDL